MSAHFSKAEDGNSEAMKLAAKEALVGNISEYYQMKFIVKHTSQKGNVLFKNLYNF